MSKVRRSVGAFVLASVVATGLVLTPEPAHAWDLAGFCAYLDQAIASLESRPQSAGRDLLLAKLYAVKSTYCAG